MARDADTWRLVHREAAGNALTARASRGRVVKTYPLVVAVDARQRAEVVVQGGLGYVPVTFTDLASSRGYALSLNNRPLDQSVHGGDFWQTDYDPGRQRWQMTFNVPLAGERAHVLRFTKAP